MLFQSNNRYQHISQSEERHEHSREAGDIGKRLFSVSHSSFLCLLLFASIVTNVAFFAKKLPKGLDTCNCVSTYGRFPSAQPLCRHANAHFLEAGIDGYNYPQALLENRTYVDQDDLTTTMQAWEALSGDPGVVALSDEFVADKGLPVAMRYPWDESKGVYLLQGFHNLHCIVSRVDATIPNSKLEEMLKYT